MRTANICLLYTSNSGKRFSCVRTDSAVRIEQCLGKPHHNRGKLGSRPIYCIGNSSFTCCFRHNALSCLFRCIFSHLNSILRGKKNRCIPNDNHIGRCCGVKPHRGNDRYGFNSFSGYRNKQDFIYNRRTFGSYHEEAPGAGNHNIWLPYCNIHI